MQHKESILKFLCNKNLLLESWVLNRSWKRHLIVGEWLQLQKNEYSLGNFLVKNSSIKKNIYPIAISQYKSISLWKTKGRMVTTSPAKGSKAKEWKLKWKCNPLPWNSLWPKSCYFHKHLLKKSSMLKIWSQHIKIMEKSSRSFVQNYKITTSSTTTNSDKRAKLRNHQL